MPDVSEISLKDWIESTWFKGLSRLVMLAGGAVFMIGTPIVGSMVRDTLEKIDQLQVSTTTLRSEFQQSEAINASRFAAQVDSNKALVRRVDNLVSDVGEISGQIEQISRRDTRPVAGVYTTDPL